LIFGAHPYPNVVLWSLEVEVQFYLLAPFLASLFFLQTKWHRRTLMIVSILAFSFLETFFGLADYRIGFSLLGNLQYFLVGFFLADLYLARWLDAAQLSLAWDALALLGSLIVFVLHPAPALTPILPWILLACCVAAFKGSIVSRCLSNAWITTMGGMCYTIYLYHSLLISTAIRLTKKLKTGFLSLDLLLQLLLMTPIIIAICSVLFLLLERPFMRRSWPADLRQFVRSKLN
jgi:peptidoglycan/LPS O-acetylase OafA/YrhL